MTGGGGKCAVCKIVGLLAGLGALNWGLVALFDLDLVEKVFGVMTTGSRIVYGLVGLSGLLLLLSCFKLCPCQRDGSCAPK